MEESKDCNVDIDIDIDILFRRRRKRRKIFGEGEYLFLEEKKIREGKGVKYLEKISQGYWEVSVSVSVSKLLPIFGGFRYRFWRIWSQKKKSRFRRIWSRKKSFDFGFGQHFGIVIQWFEPDWICGLVAYLLLEICFGCSHLFPFWNEAHSLTGCPSNQNTI